MITALINNLCWCKEYLGYNEPIVHRTNDSQDDYEAPKYEILFNNSRLIFRDGCAIYCEYYLEIIYYIDTPPDCFYIGSGSKARVEMSASAIEEMTGRLRRLVLCLVDKTCNPFAQGYKGMKCKASGFHFDPNIRDIDFKANTDKQGATQNCEWTVSTKFRIRANYDYCEQCSKIQA